MLARKTTARCSRIHAVGPRQRDDQGDDDDNRRVDVHQRADDNQEDVEREQEHDLRGNGGLGPVEQPHRDFGNHQVVGEAERHAENDQEAAEERGAFDGDAREIPPDTELRGARSIRSPRHTPPPRRLLRPAWWRPAGCRRGRPLVAAVPISPPTTRRAPHATRTAFEWCSASREKPPNQRRPPPRAIPGTSAATNRRSTGTPA